MIANLQQQQQQQQQQQRQWNSSIATTPSRACLLHVWKLTSVPAARLHLDAFAVTTDATKATFNKAKHQTDSSMLQP
jgi:hypothetical protein